MITVTYKSGKAVVTITDGDRVVGLDRFDPASARSRRALAGSIGVSDTALLDASERSKASGKPEPVESQTPTPAQTVASVTVRPLDAKAESPPVPTPDIPSFAATLSAPVDHVVEWESKEAFCCLDVDYHGVTPPSRVWLEGVVRAELAPQPFAWHFSRSGGLHLFYTASGAYTAEELAAAAALRFRTVDSSAGLELKRVVRGAGDETVHVIDYQDTNASLSAWVGSPDDDDDAWEEWLERNGLEQDRRYTHDKCPIDPTPDTGEKRDPVVVGEHGVYCFRCEGLGRSLGSRRPGWAPRSSLTGSPSSGLLGAMIRGLCHWGHARHVLTEHYGLPEALARLAYRGALKAYHGDRETAPLVHAAFQPVTDGLARVNDQWYSLADGYAFPRDIQGLISALPASMAVTDPDKPPKTVPSKLTLLLQPIDHTERGYPSVEPVYGFRMAQRFLNVTSYRPQVTVPMKELHRVGAKALPRYVAKKERMRADEAWGVIEETFPRVDRTLITLALVAFGVSQETRSGMAPIVFLSGPTGVAKTTTIRLAAAILGAKTRDAVFDADDTRFRQSLHAGAQGPALLLNELLKDAERGRNARTPREALDPLLNLTPDSLFRGNYRDPVQFGRLPSVWITDTNCPQELVDEGQIARRVRHYRVWGTKDDWPKTISAAGIPNGDVHLYRLVSSTVSDACNAVLSEVVDTWFVAPATWDSIADALGVHQLNKSEQFDDLTPHLMEFFRLVCEAPELDGNEAKRFGRGFKKVHRIDSENPLTAYYSTFADGNGERWLRSRKLLERDWSKLLGTDLDCRCEIRDNGQDVFVRFAAGPTRKPSLLNEELRR